MKLFDGLTKYTYQTIFGKIELVKSKEHGVIYKFHDEVSVPNIRVIPNGRLFYMRFDTRVKAFKKLKEMETLAIKEFSNFLENEI